MMKTLEEANIELQMIGDIVNRPDCWYPGDTQPTTHQPPAEDLQLTDNGH